MSTRRELWTRRRMIEREIAGATEALTAWTRLAEIVRTTEGLEPIRERELARCELKAHAASAVIREATAEAHAVAEQIGMLPLEEG